MLAGADVGLGHVPDVGHRPGELDGGELAGHELVVGWGEREGGRDGKEGRGDERKGKI